MAGEVEEHVVEAGLAERHPRLERELGPVENPERSHHRSCAFIDREFDRGTSDRRLLLGRAGQLAGGDGGSVLVGEGDLEHRAAELGLEFGGRALGDDPAVIDHRDAVGEAIGLLEILRREKQRRSLGDEFFEDGPQFESALRDPGLSWAHP